MKKMSCKSYRDRQFGSKSVGQRASTILAGPVFNIILSMILFGVLTLMTGVKPRFRFTR